MERFMNFIRARATLVVLVVSFVTIFMTSLLNASEPKIVLLPLELFGPSEAKSQKEKLEEALILEFKKRGFEVVGPKDLALMGISPTPEEATLKSLISEHSPCVLILGSFTKLEQATSLDGRIILPQQERPFSMPALPGQPLIELVQKFVQEVTDLVRGVVKVAEVEVVGNVRIEKDAILAVMKTKKGERLDNQALDEDLKAIFKMGYFDDVLMEAHDVPEGKKIVIKVVERPSIGKIIFKGNKKISEEDLIKEFGIKQYSIFNEKKIKDGIVKLKEFYKKKGFYQADIHYEVSTLPNNQLELKVNIKEGSKIYITDIQFIGNKHFSSGKLKKIMETSEKGFFSWLTDSGILDKKKLEYDIQKLLAFYHNNGFITARVGDPKVEETEKGLRITIEVFEGERYKVRSVDIAGDIVVPVSELKKKLQMKKGEVFNREKVRSDVLAIMEATVDQGYAYAEVLPDIDQDDQAKEIGITYNIVKGEKVKVSRIEISGNTNTRDKVIRRELQINEGEYYSGSRLKESVDRLNRLGFFEEVETQLERRPEPDQVDLKVRIKEGHTGSLSFGGGYSSEVRGFIMSKISQQNFLGLGQTLSLSARLGGRGSEFDMSFVEPWLFDKPISFSTNAYRTTTDYDDFDRRSLGFGTGLGFPLRGLDRFTRGAIRYLIDSSDIYNLNPDASLLIRDMEGRNLTSSLSFVVSRDTRNRAWNPSKGSLNMASLEYAGGPLGGDVYFTRYTFRSAWFIELPFQTVFAAQGRWGFIEGRSGGKLPVYQRFMIGGINTVRGFDFASISPKDPMTGEKIGGVKQMIYNVEFQFPLIKEQGVIGLIFADLGNVYTREENMGFTNLRTSAGLGVRWYSPMGPLRLEWGKNLDPRPGEASSKWEFSVGTLF